MRKSESRQIGEYKFTVQQMPAMRATRLLHRISKAVGPALAKAMGGAEGGASFADLDVSQLAPALELLFDRLSEDDLDQIVRELLETSTVELQGRQGRTTKPLLPLIDELLEVQDVLNVARFALEVNFKGFFGALVKSGGALAALRSTSLPDSPKPGPATDSSLSD